MKQSKPNGFASYGKNPLLFLTHTRDQLREHTIGSTLALNRAIKRPLSMVDSETGILVMIQKSPASKMQGFEMI